MQDAHHPPDPALEAQDTSDFSLSPVVVITLVGKAEDGEGDIGALHGVLERLKVCPMFQVFRSLGFFFKSFWLFFVPSISNKKTIRFGNLSVFYLRFCWAMQYSSYMFGVQKRRA